MDAPLPDPQIAIVRQSCSVFATTSICSLPRSNLTSSRRLSSSLCAFTIA